MPMVEAISVFGNTVSVPKEKFTLRVSAYGIVIHEQKLLLVNTRSTGKWFFPGGGVEIGETLEDAIKRECMEEAGIEVEVEKFFTCKEVFFYYDPFDTGFQNYAFFYTCNARTFEVTEKNQVEFDEAEKPTWVDMQTLTEDDFQTTAKDVFRMLKQMYL